MAESVACCGYHNRLGPVIKLLVVSVAVGLKYPVEHALAVFALYGLAHIDERGAVLVCSEEEVYSGVVQILNAVALAEHSPRNLVCYARPVGKRALNPSGYIIIHKEELDCLCHGTSP